MLLPRASDLEEEPTIDKVLEYARNITECPIYVGSLPKWTFLLMVIRGQRSNVQIIESVYRRAFMQIVYIH